MRQQSDHQGLLRLGSVFLFVTACVFSLEKVIQVSHVGNLICGDEVYRMSTHGNKRRITHPLSPFPHWVQGVVFLVRHERDVASGGDFLCSLLPVKEEQVTSTGFETKPLSYGE